MKRAKIGWTAVATLLSIPYLVLIALGSLWLFERHWAWEWFILSGVCVTAGWGLVHWLRGRTPLVAAVSQQPGGDWPPAGHQAWEQINALAERIEAERPPLDSPEALWRLLRKVLQTVAQHYHPKSRQALLEIPVPHILRIVELVAVDLRTAFPSTCRGPHPHAPRFSPLKPAGLVVRATLLRVSRRGLWDQSGLRRAA